MYKTFLAEFNSMNESSRWEAIIQKASNDIQKLVVTTNPAIEAFFIYMDGRYASEKEAVKDLENLGSFEFQNSYDELWDKHDEDGLDKVTWGDLADLSLSEIKAYKKKFKNGITQARADNITKQLRDIK